MRLSSLSFTQKRRGLIAVVLMVVIALGALIGLSRKNPGPQSVFQGYVEGNLVYIAPETTGTIATLKVVEGQEMQVGQPLFSLESTTQLAQRDQAQAQLIQAQAQLKDLLAAQQRPEQIAVLRAQVNQAKAQWELAQSDLQRQKKLFARGYSAQAALDQAQSSYDNALAGLTAAQRQISAAELAARSDTIQAAEANVIAATAALTQLQSIVSKREVKAPTAARVQEIFFRPGEVVNASQPVLSLLPPQNLKYRLYVPEPALTSIRLGQQVRVSCDNCAPDLRARISFISGTSEFTPPVIFSDEERAKLVFMVEAMPLNGTAVLPIGLPVKLHLDMTGGQR